MGAPRMNSLEFNVWQVEQTDEHAKMHVELYEDDGFFIVEVFTRFEPGDEHRLIKQAFAKRGMITLSKTKRMGALIS